MRKVEGKRRLAAGLLAALALLAGAPAGAQSGGSQAAAWNRPVAPYRIAGSVHYVGVEGVAAYLITTSDGHILIDGGLEASAPRILHSIRALGFRPRDVKYLLVSHAHFDHAGGLAALKAATGAQLVATAEERPALEQGRHFGDNDNGVGRFPAVRVDHVVRDGGRLSLGGVVLTAHLTPGHTKGCTGWSLPLVEAGRAHRAFFHCSSTVAGNVLVGNKAYPGIVADYRRTFARLKRIRADIFLANHPGFARLAEKRARVAARAPNPFVDPTELQRFAAASERDFEAELTRQQARVRP